MTLLAHAWIGAHRLRRRLAPTFDREALVREHAPARSFLDVGCMWSVHGRIAFLAEQSGATEVTGIDLIGPTPQFQVEHEQRGSRVRFVGGDLHDPDTIAAAGPHDVVWCTGVLYHAPHPLLTLERLRSACRELLLLGSETLPELPGIRGGCVFYPALDERRRRVYGRVPGGEALAVTGPYDPAREYGNWFWGITPSALLGMLDVTGFSVERVIRTPFHTYVVARPPPVSGAKSRRRDKRG